MKLQIQILLIVSILSCGKPLTATNYYISNTGNDSKEGTSPSQAWKSIARVNSQSFNAGDSILFNKGDRFYGSLEIKNSGNSSNHITYSGYGSGDKPRIFGSIAATSFSPHSSLSYVYSCDENIPINPNDYDDFSYNGSIYFMINDSITWGDGEVDYVSSGVSGLTRNFHWTYENETVYFYYDGDIGEIDTVECTQLARGINISAEYITIDGLHLRYFGSRCVGHSPQPERTKQGLIIRNGEFAYTGSKDEGVGFGLSLIHSNSLIEKNKIHGNGRRNISMYIQNYASDAVIRDVIIQNNEIYDGYHTGIDMAIHGGTAQMKNIVIRNNKIWEWHNIEKTHKSNAINMINNGDFENYDSIFVYNNQLLNFNGSGIFIMGIKNLFVVNNSFVASKLSVSAFLYFPNIEEQGNTVIVNNIFLNYEDKGGFINGTNKLTNSFTVDHNLYYNEASTFYLMENDPETGDSYKYQYWRDYQASGYEANGIYDSLPHFVDSLYDLRLKPSSPAIERGIPIPYIKEDFDGNPRDRVNPDIGAFEYGYTPLLPENNYKGISIYPNPANNKLTLNIIEYEPSNELLNVKILDVKGSLVYEENLLYTEENIDLETNLPSGVYYYKVKMQGVFSATEPVVIIN